MKKKRIIALAAALCSTFTAVADTPLLKVPYIEPEAVESLFVSGGFDDPWAGAAVVEKFNNVGNTSGIPVATKVQLFHDGANILIRAELTEPHPVFAGERSWQESFVADSAFRFALGAGSLGVSESTIAGYDSPYSSRQDLRHFYEYTINAAGYMSRQYNECPVRDPRFDGRAFLTADGWEVWMIVPLAGAGIEWKPGDIYYCNLNRFYQGARYGWVLGGFGGYTALQFGMLELLPQERNAERSAFAPLPPPSAKRAAIPRPAKARLTYYPLGGKVTAETPRGAEGATATLTVNGVSGTFDVGPDATGIFSVDVDLPAGSVFTAELKQNGNIIASGEYTVPEKPEWYGSQAGIEYLTDRVAFPWKPVEFDNGTVHLAHSDWYFGDSTLPQRITVMDKEILQGGMYVTGILDDGSEVLMNDIAVKRDLMPVALSSETVNNVQALEIKSHVEFDGFGVFRLRASGLGETSWQELAVHIPINPGICEFLNFGYSQELLRIGQGGYIGNPSNFWVGNGNSGLAFSYDRDCFPNGTAAPKVEIYPGEIIIRLADTGSGTFPADFVWQFFLQPTPVRGDFIPPFSHTMSTGAFERWSRYQGYPDLEKIPEVRQTANTIHGNGNKLYVYFSNILAENSPGYTEYRTDLEALPQRMWYKRAYDPGRDVQCFVSCLRHERGDQMLHGVETLLEECGIDGVYLDGPTVAFSCDNPGHDCCDSLPAVWDDDYNSGRILGQRAFLKRLRGIFDAKGIKYPLWSHTGGDIFTSTLSLADYYYDGEQMSRFRDGYLVEPEKFRINFALSGLGVRGRFLPILYFDSTWTNRQSLPIALVHATETSSLEKQHPLVDFFFRYLRQEDPAEFYPYWEEQPHWQVTADETVFASYLRNDTEGVLVISNLYQDGEKEVSIELGDFFDGEDFAIACLTNPGAAFVQEGSKITFRLKPATMKVFYITTNDSFPEDMPSPERAVGNTAPADPIPQNQVFNDADWVITPGMLQNDGSIHFPADRTAAASVAYKGRLPEPFTVRMTLEHSSALNFYVDEIKFTYNKGTGWLIKGIDEYENEDYCAVSHKGHRGGHEALNRPVELVISMEDDHLNVAYDGARLLHYALPAVDNASHTIKVEAPAGSDVKLQLQEIKNEGEIPFSDFEIMHPVL